MTKRGQLAIGVRECTLLAKALRDPPDLFHGISDPETRYRQRELDLMANERSREVFKLRAKVLAAIRDHMNERGLVELETPILQRLTGGAAARPFVTHHNALDRHLFLRTATELYLKRAIVGGFEDVYEFGKFFRNEGMSPQHNPEFTMLEMFVGGADYNGVMAFAEVLVAGVVERVLGTTKVERDGVDDRLRGALAAGHPARRDAARRPASTSTRRAATSWPSWPATTPSRRRLGRAGRHPAGQAGRAEADPAHLHLRPADRHLAAGQGAPRRPQGLARPSTGSSPGWRSSAAAPTSTTRSSSASRFIEQRERQETGAEDDPHPHDEEFVRALEYGMPPASGCGLGIDRLLMIMTGSKTLRDVIIFPAMREAEAVGRCARPRRACKSTPPPHALAWSYGLRRRRAGGRRRSGSRCR